MSTTMNTNTTKPRSVQATLNYLTPPADGSRPYMSTYKIDPATGKLETNYGENNVDVQIEDLRGNEGYASLNTTGFQFGVAASKVKGFRDEQEIRDIYYPECAAEIKKATGAAKVVVFDHTVRRNDPTVDGSDAKARAPARSVHVDQTHPAVIARIYRHLPPSEAFERSKGRFQIINLWRSFAGPAWDTPLALCDYRSVDYDKDLIPVAHIYEEMEGETFGVKYSPDHRWKYVSGMRPDEYVLIKCGDSEIREGLARLTPHTAFVDPSTPADAPLRESIELRALVFYE